MRVWIGAARFESRSNRSDPAVHHVAGRDDVHAGLGLHQRLLGQHGHGAVVDDVAAVVQQPVLAVTGEGVERHVGQDAQFGEAFLQFANGARHQPGRVGGLASVGRLQRGLDHREQRHHRDAQRDAFLGRGEQPVDAAPLHAGHAGHVLRLLRAVEHEHRQDQVFGRQALLAHQRTGEGVAAQAAGAAGGVGRGRMQVGRPVFRGRLRPRLAGPATGPKEAAANPGKTALSQKPWLLLEWKMNDSRKVFIPCFSSLSRRLNVLTAIRLAGPGLVPGPFSWRRSCRQRPR